MEKIKAYIYNTLFKAELSEDRKLNQILIENFHCFEIGQNYARISDDKYGVEELAREANEMSEAAKRYPN